MAGSLFEFAEQSKDDQIHSGREKPLIQGNPWHVLIVDDEPYMHDVTKLVLVEFSYDGRPIELTHAYTAREARSILEESDKYAVVLLDVVMEEDDSGLELVNYIRNELKNNLIRIILRTGQPGQAPELKVVLDYDINDYREKSELTVEKLISCLTNALRSYRDIKTIHELQQKLSEHNKELLLLTNNLRDEVRERTHAQKKLALSNAKLESIINNSATLISLKNVDGEYELANQAFNSQLVFKSESIIGKKDSDIFDDDIASMIQYNDQKVAQTLQPIQCEEVLPTTSGEHFFLCIKFPLLDAKGKLLSICTICTDIAERLDAHNEILRLAQHDALTDLPNRSLFIDRMKQAVERVERNERHFAVLFIDLDKFKNINDTLGHQYGDKVLIDVAHRLRKLLRAEDSVCRLGGDEFAVLLVDLAQEYDALKVTMKIHESLSTPYECDGIVMHVTPSIGISCCPRDGKDVQVLLKKSDIAMYRAKKQGRNGYHFYVEEDDVQVRKRITLEMEMRDTLNNHISRLQLVYQPKLNVYTGDIRSVEALLRWHHPAKGIVKPHDFVPMLDEIGLMVDVGQWVLREACDFAVRKAKEGTPMMVGVNLSPTQVYQDGFVSKLRSIMDSAGCQPEWLELELTEQTLIQDGEIIKTVLEKISDLGVRIAINNFGIGYSSLNLLRELPVNSLKLDRKLINDALTQLPDEAMLKAIVHFANRLNMDVIAEGIETKEQYQLFHSMLMGEELGYVQGFLFSEPVSEHELGGAITLSGDKWRNLG